MEGSYALILKTPREAEIGSLGRKEFDKPYAVYNGSAMGPGGFKRVLRHFSSDKNIYWHIDYLLDSSELLAALIFPERDLECALSSKITNRSVKGFGCSDCECDSHLFLYDSFRDALSIGNIFSDVKILDQNRYQKYEDREGEKSIEEFIRNLPNSDSYKE